MVMKIKINKKKMREYSSRVKYRTISDDKIEFLVDLLGIDEASTYIYNTYDIRFTRCSYHHEYKGRCNCTSDFRNIYKIVMSFKLRLLSDEGPTAWKRRKWGIMFSSQVYLVEELKFREKRCQIMKQS